MVGIEEWARREQVCLWDDLDRAISNSLNGIWSMDAWSSLVRAVTGARIMGITAPEDVQWRLLAGGVYEIGCELAGQPWADRDAVLIEYEPVMVRSGQPGVRDTRLAMARTLAAIREPREWRSILEELEDLEPLPSQ